MTWTDIDYFIVKTGEMDFSDVKYRLIAAACKFEDMIDSLSYTNNLSSCEIKKLKFMNGNTSSVFFFRACLYIVLRSSNI